MLEAAWQIVVVEGRERTSLSDIAERAGVHHSSVYRRWESVDALVLDGAAARLAERSPVPDTGSLIGDLSQYAANAAASLHGVEGLTLLRAILALSPHAGGNRETVAAALRERGDYLQEMLDRAASRGEPRLKYVDVLDCILAPLYMRRLFGLSYEDPALFADLVEMALSRAVPAIELGQSDAS